MTKRISQWWDRNFEDGDAILPIFGESEWDNIPNKCYDIKVENDDMHAKELKWMYEDLKDELTQINNMNHIKGSWLYWEVSKNININGISYTINKRQFE